MSDEDIRATDVETMGLEAVQAELPSTAAGAVRIQEHLERRQRALAPSRRADQIACRLAAHTAGTRGELARHQAPTRRSSWRAR